MQTNRSVIADINQPLPNVPPVPVVPAFFNTSSYSNSAHLRPRPHIFYKSREVCFGAGTTGTHIGPLGFLLLLSLYLY